MDKNTSHREESILLDDVAICNRLLQSHSFLRNDSNKQIGEFNGIK